jgi:ABC-type nickel/cobalt efflux system permease component RcnA
MTGTLLRILIFTAIILLILWGLRKIWRDWTGQFKQLDKERHERDLRERQRPDVITLKRDKDGKFRPPEDDGRS